MARSHGSCTSRKTNQEALQKACEETARAKRFRSNSYGLPAARRRSKGASLARVRENRVFARKWKSTAGAPAARNGIGATRNKARARGEPSPGPPASERRTQDHWATSPAAGPRCARGPRAGKRPRPRKRKFSALQNLAPNLDLSSEADSEARKTHAELKNKLQEAPVLGAPVRPFWL